MRSCSQALAVTLALLWGLSTAIVTFGGLFRHTGNGFFGAWFATFSAFSFFYQTFISEGIGLGRGIAHSLSFQTSRAAGDTLGSSGMGSTMGSTITPPTPIAPGASNVA